MKINEANIDIIRKDNILNSVSVAMPIWDKVGNDELLAIDIPLFGIKTVAKDPVDAEVAIRESIQLFCLSAEKFGKGLENELKVMGWSFIEQSENFTSMSFSVPSQNTVIDQIMNTGGHFAQKLELSI
eukprot:m.465037 g.465037  ORF g.465037 m.465037 type:complete len:128 (+) comp23942_c0_seq1:49-432(+)